MLSMNARLIEKQTDNDVLRVLMTVAIRAAVVLEVFLKVVLKVMLKVALRATSRVAIRKVAFLFSVVMFLSACTTFEYHETVNVPISKVSEQQEALLDEELIMDVGVVLFDHGVDILDDDAAAYANVRKSEAVWYSEQLKKTLDKSNAWGLVRALPNDSGIMDVIVKGRLVDSNGEQVTLSIQAKDATGKLWFEKEYHQTASQYAYNPEVNLPGDPFQAMFNRVANDLFDYRAALSDAQILNVRNTAKVLFARDFVPAAFNGYISENESGEVSLLRIPAKDDPVMKKVDRIRARNDLFLDVIQDYYRAFNNTMSIPYEEWRKLSYKEVLYARQLKEQARKEKIAGVVAIASGVVAANSSRSGTTRTAGWLGSIYGARVFANSFRKYDQALQHSETLRELGLSLEAELEPSVVDLQDRSVTLTGTVEDQYTEWRRILTRMFEIEEGEPASNLENVDNSQQTEKLELTDDKSQARLN